MSDTARPVSPITAPARWYGDPSLWPAERAGIFAKGWQFLTHESVVAAPRTYAADVLAGYPVIVVRGEDDVLRGFHNVCRHRAGPLTRDTEGTCDGTLTCQYHGWRFTLDGRLRSARDFGAAADFDPRDYSLFPVRVEVWRGLVFVGIADDLPELSTQMAPLDVRLGGADWSSLHLALKRQHSLDCNWKTYVENYLEGYHIPAMHPSLDAEIVSADYRATIEGRVVLHDAPPRNGDAVVQGLWGWVWPNIGLNVYARGLMIERMSPVGPHTTRLDYFYLTPDGETVSPDTLILSDQVTAEDKWITEKVQENLNAGIYDTGRLSPRHETALNAFQSWVGAVIAT